MLNKFSDNVQEVSTTINQLQTEFAKETCKRGNIRPPIQEIEHFLHKLDGIERVLVDIADGEVKIEFDEKKTSGDRIVGSLQQQNFRFM